jgi:hypothetical protein
MAIAGEGVTKRCVSTLYSPLTELQVTDLCIHCSQMKLKQN